MLRFKLLLIILISALVVGGGFAFWRVASNDGDVEQER